jgi:biopolymer transport protein ExbB/TolQ
MHVSLMNKRVKMAAMAFGIADAFIAVLSIVLPDGFAADFLLDRSISYAPYPFTIQNLMWIIFFWGCSELYFRHLESEKEDAQIEKGLLPEDEHTVLRKQELGPIYKRIKDTDKTRNYFLQRLLSRCILQFQGASSIDQVNSVFNSSLELYQNEIELRYNILRYIVWLIPTLGFIGTVVGIALALSTAGAAPDFQDPALLKSLTKDLGVAFYTTLLALIMSAILMFALHIIQGKEEAALNRIGQYTLDNLVNRLYSN